MPGLEGDPRCELYLEEIKGSSETAAAMRLVAAAEMVELDLLGGKGATGQVP
ncbi:hypothetical protein [Nonomuraea sp. CA-141351]|uniref:hypothetical protein n=1 Tax=Nonomuraea sp. CA-141351 TaxID=3239996 RepID=UPI003D8B5BBB